MVIPNIGQTCRYTFIDSWSNLDGVYELVQQLSFTEIKENKIDLVKTTYTVANKTAADYENDLPTFTGQVFLKLINPTNENIVYVPTVFIAKIPEYDIHIRTKLVLTLDLGVFNDIGEINTITNTVKSIISTSYGITAEPVIFSYGSEYLSDNEYAAIEDERELNKSQTVNYYSETQRLISELNEAKNKIIAYESLLKTLNGA